MFVYSNARFTFQRKHYLFMYIIGAIQENKPCKQCYWGQSAGLYNAIKLAFFPRPNSPNIPCNTVYKKNS